MKKLTRNLSKVVLVFIGISVSQCKDAGRSTEKTESMDAEQKPAAVTQSSFGTTPEGREVEKYTLSNEAGMEIEVITYGGRITSWKVPGKGGESQNVVLGFDNLEQYLGENPYFGALIGRYGNRIANASFTLNDTTYKLAANDGKNHLHGGVKGFDRVIWTANVPDASQPVLELSYLSADMEEGYPGNLQVKVVYDLKADNTLEVRYEASTDKATVVNLTQHAYFNLSGDFSQDILDHEVVIDADNYLPVDETLIPTGTREGVEGTPFDFTSGKLIGAEIGQEHTQLERGLGYDHCWVLNEQGDAMHFAASAYHPESGRFMEVYTQEPGIQFYTGNFLDGTLERPDGGAYEHRTGFCLETQHFPDSPNQPEFPSVTLNPGETYKTKTQFKFSVK